jgi:hypothetical protein
MSKEPDNGEVFRSAHELRERHGRNAANYAAKLAAEALAEGDIENHQFWEAVKAALTVR